MLYDIIPASGIRPTPVLGAGRQKKPHKKECERDVLWDETEHVAAECEKWTQFSCTELMEIELSSSTRQSKRSSDLQHPPPPPPVTTNFSTTRMQEEGKFLQIPFFFCFLHLSCLELEHEH